MGQSLFLPAAVALLGALAVIFFAKPKAAAWGAEVSPAAAPEAATPAAASGPAT
jgi:hypothetical protein